VPVGDRILIEMPGGGGLGNPHHRKADTVAADCRAGLVSHQAARKAYGVALTNDGAVDEKATARLRA